MSGQHSPNVILKDNDIKYKIRLPPDTAVQLLQQIRKDADFLDSMRIMDYSLLVGVHNAEYDVDALRRRTKSKLTTASQSSVSSLTGSGRIQEVSSKPSREGNGLQTSSGNSGEDNNARNVSNQRGSGETDSLLGSAPGEVKYLNPNKIDVMRVVGPDSYFIGIIDFQQRWTVKKKVSPPVRSSLALSLADPFSPSRRLSDSSKSISMAPILADSPPSSRPSTRSGF